MKTIDRIKRDLLQGKRITARNYSPKACHMAIQELQVSMPILTNWQTSADSPLEGLRLRERTYRLHASALNARQIVGMAVRAATPTAGFKQACKKGRT